MRVLVTGGTGFVGSHFLNQAMAAGYEIVALRRPGARSRVPLLKEPEWLERPLDELREEDFDQVKVVVHLAAHSANVPYDTLENCLRWNVLAPLRMAQVAHAAGVPRFIVAGSCFEYGRSAERYEFVPTDAPLEPTASYPTSKAAASVAFIGFAQEKALSLSVLRIFQVYGPGELDSRFWPSLKRTAERDEDMPMSPGEQIRDFVHVEEVARQFVEELAANVPAGQPVIRNVGTGKPMSLRAFAEHWWSTWQAKGRLLIGAVPYRAGEVMRFAPKI